MLFEERSLWYFCLEGVQQIVLHLSGNYSYSDSFLWLAELYMHEARQKPFNSVKNPFKEGGQAVFVFSVNLYQKTNFSSVCDPVSWFMLLSCRSWDSFL